MRRASSFANGAFVLVGEHLSAIEVDRQVSGSRLVADILAKRIHPDSTDENDGHSGCSPTLRRRLSSAVVQRFESTPLNSSAHRHCDDVNGARDSARQCRIGLVDDNAGQSAENYLDLAFLIATAFRPVDIRKANCNPLDRRYNPAKLHRELSSDVVAVLIVDRSADDPNMRRN
jgi:hypothetical protein